MSDRPRVKTKDLPGQRLLPGRGFPRPPRRRAWRVTWTGRDFPPGIAAAESRARARYLALASAIDAGWAPIFSEIRAVRAPEFDAWAAADATGRIVVEDYLALAREDADPCAS